MKRSFKIGIISVIFIIGIVFLVNNLIFPIFQLTNGGGNTTGGGTNYVIVCPDAFFGDSVLNSFVNSQSGRTAVKLSDIYAWYDANNNSTSPSLLSVKHIENIQSSFDNTYVFTSVRKPNYYTPNDTDNDYPFYTMLAYSIEGTFSSVQSLTNPANIMLNYGYANTNYIHSGNIILTYDGGQQITISLSNINIGWDYCGMPFVTSSGNIWFQPTTADKIRTYLMTKYNNLLNYVLLLGDITQIPSFDLRLFPVYAVNPISYYIWESRTDEPFAVKDLYSMTTQMIPSFAVGRLPAQNLVDMENMLTKSMNYQPNQSGKAVWVTSNKLGDDTELFQSVTNELPRLYGNMTTYYADNSSSDALALNLNTGNDIVGISCHGGSPAICISDDNVFFTTSDVNKLNYQNFSLIWAYSCWTADFSRYQANEGLGEAFISSTTCKDVVYIGAVIPTITGNSLFSRFFTDIYNERTVGQSWIHALSEDYSPVGIILYDRMSWELLGEPSIALTKGTLPLSAYGTFSVETKAGIYDNTTGWHSSGYIHVDYTITKPDRSVIVYANVSGLQTYSFPMGDYTVKITAEDSPWKGLSDKTINIVVRSGVNAGSFGYIFVYRQYSGSLSVDNVLNIDASNAIVDVNGTVLSDEFLAPVHLYGLPNGNYTISLVMTNDYLDYKIPATTLSLNNNQEVSYSLNFGYLISNVDYVGILLYNMQYVLFGLGLVLMLVWRKDIFK